MKKLIVLFLFISASLVVADEPVRIVGATTAKDGLPAVVGARNIEIFHSVAGGWTYNHHTDMAAWKGRLYVAWDSSLKDEDVGISREQYVTSEDGEKWSAPALLFPEGTSTEMRMYFFRASNGRMLAIAGLRLSADTPADVKRSGLIVREIHADHSLGEVYTLRLPTPAPDMKLLPLYSTAVDRGFVESCSELLQNKPFLEQQDYGLLLGDQKMKWHDINNWPMSEPSRADFPNRFGKGICFFHRADGAVVGVMKWGWVILSRDGGETWSQPVRPKTLITGMAKIWGQRTHSGKYVLIYNPDPVNRFPLVMVHGDDGIKFGDMRIVNGDHPKLRFPGLNKGEGAQYVRGISEWASDGSWKDSAVWVAYSQGKEDIWVSRVPVP
jgi:hypothetical protein